MTENPPLTTDDESVRVITHDNGDTTIVGSGVTDDQAAELAKLTGDDVNKAVAAIVEEDRKAELADDVDTATERVVSDPPDAGLRSSSDAGLAGPDPLRQGGPSVPPVPFGAIPDTAREGGEDAETLKATGDGEGTEQLDENGN